VLKRKYMIIAFLAFCLAAALFVGVTTSGTTPSVTASAPYDPWCDINDDGVINIIDIVSLGIRFDTTGTPINKAALWKAGNISVPAAAFAPAYDGYDWRNYGSVLSNWEASGYAVFVTSVQLPHGATITNLTTYWMDSGIDTISCHLFRYNQTSQEWMASAYSPGLPAPGYGSSYDDTINYATVDNNERTYYLEVDVPAPYYNYFFQYALIEYEYP